MLTEAISNEGNAERKSFGSNCGICTTVLNGDIALFNGINRAKYLKSHHVREKDER